MILLRFSTISEPHDTATTTHMMNPNSCRLPHMNEDEANKAWSSNRPEAFQLRLIRPPFAPVRSL